MGSFCQQVIDRIKTKDAGTYKEDQTLAIAGELLARRYIADYNSGGLYPDADNETVSPEEAVALQAALIEFGRSCGPDRNLSEVLWALSRARDPSVLPFVTDALSRCARHLLNANAGLHHALLALEGNGELSPRSRSRMEVECNLKEAMSFLRTKGVIDLGW